MSQNDVGPYQYTRFHPDTSMHETPTRIALVRPADIAGDRFERAQEALSAVSKWRLKLEEEGTHGFVVPLKMVYDEDAEPSRAPEVALSKITDLQAWLDPMLLGAVAYKPSAFTRGDLGRVPVAVQMAPPKRTEPSGRRRVVALLDTAVADHPWWSGDPADDRFIVDAESVPNKWKPGPRLDPPSERTPELAEQEGHGTFSAGLIRQIAPNARVLAVRIMADDGTVYGDHVLNALQWIADSNEMVSGDVVCLPVGFRPVLPADGRYLDWLAEVLGVVANKGVTVVTSAGNEGRTDPVYPAAFASSVIPEEFWIRSVGATNVDGDDAPAAYYSNVGQWVTDWEVGTSVVSTFPAVNAAATPEFDLKGKGGERGRQTADPDDFRSGFARWSGTSFSAAIHAAKLAAGKDRRKQQLKGTTDVRGR